MRVGEGIGVGRGPQRHECLRPQGHRGAKRPPPPLQDPLESELTGSGVQERRMVQDPSDKDRRAGG